MNNLLEYDEDKLLTEAETSELATLMLSQYLSLEDYEILDVKKSRPCQIKALHNDLRYLILVITSASKYSPRMSYLAKDSFVNYCLKNNIVPLLASINLRSANEEHYLNDVILKGDKIIVEDMKIKDLSTFKLDKNYKDKLYVLELVKDAFNRHDFTIFNDLLTKDGVYYNYLINEVIKGKDSIIKYLKQSEKNNAFGYIVEDEALNVRILFMHEDEENDYFIDLEFNDQQKINKIIISEYDFEDYHAYYDI